VPYQFGQLGAREAGMAAEVERGFVRDGDVVMCDGHGLMHPERMGLGIHLAARLARPVVAVAKNPLHREAPKTSTERGSVRSISDAAGVVGAEVRTVNSVRPVYVSVGGGISLNSAIELVLEASRYRIPEPVRLADKEARKGLREMLENILPNRTGI
jgi:deoxyribonuclease V